MFTRGIEAVETLNFGATKVKAKVLSVATTAECVMVSTRIPDVVRFYRDIAFFADSADEFADQVAHVLQTDNTERIEAGRQLAEDSSLRTQKSRAPQEVALTQYPCQNPARLKARSKLNSLMLSNYCQLVSISTLVQRFVSTQM